MRYSSRAAVAVVACLALAGCANDDGALDLDEDEGPAAVDQPSPEVVDDGPTTAEDGEEGGQLFPPLPPLEPDPDSDVPVEAQEQFLELHSEVYERLQALSVDPERDDAELERFVGEPLLSEVRETLERFRNEGLASRLPDTSVIWVRVVDSEGGPATVHECRRYGAATGLYDVETGDLVQGEQPRDFIVETRYELVLVEGEARTQAVELGGFEPEAGC